MPKQPYGQICLLSDNILGLRGIMLSDGKQIYPQQQHHQPGHCLRRASVSLTRELEDCLPVHR